MAVCEHYGQSTGRSREERPIAMGLSSWVQAFFGRQDRRQAEDEKEQAYFDAKLREQQAALETLEAEADLAALRRWNRDHSADDDR